MMTWNPLHLFSSLTSAWSNPGPCLVNIEGQNWTMNEVSEGQRRRNRLLMRDYRKFKGFRPCDMVLEEEKSKEGLCNLCPPRIFPPCRDIDDPRYDPKGRYAKIPKPYWRACRPPDFKWPDFPPDW